MNVFNSHALKKTKNNKKKKAEVEYEQSEAHVSFFHD